ncbi:MAG: universal stress protein [Desulfobacterales bacterium]|nr:universal stress protein [Desulfobacterales bacterium]
MATKKQKKILVALDGSERSLLTVKYITKMAPFEDMKIVLFNVFSGVPESYWDLEREPKSVKSVKYVRAWEVQQKKKIEEFMGQARNVLIRAGFSEAQVDVKIQQRKKGIARDIVKEARAGYEAVLTRRRGMGRIPGIILGSVSLKLLEAMSFIPLMLAGRKPPGMKYLIALDGSKDALKAVDFAGSFLSGHAVDFRLLHVIRGGEKSIEILASSDDFVLNAEKNIVRAFDEAKTRLVAKGFDPHGITTQIITGVRSRAAAIVDEGKKLDVGTIIMGRRGLSRTQDFFMGRVTNKVVYLAREKSVWIVS